MSVELGTMYRTDLEQFLFPTSCTPRVISILYKSAFSCNRHFDFILQTSRVIVKRYSLRYNVTLDAFNFFRVLLTIDTQGVHFCSKSDEFRHYRAIVLILH